MGFEPVLSFTGGLSGILPFVLKTLAVLLTRLRIDQTVGLW